MPSHTLYIRTFYREQPHVSYPCSTGSSSLRVARPLVGRKASHQGLSREFFLLPRYNFVRIGEQCCKVQKSQI